MCTESFKRKIKSLDIFGTRVGITFKGRRTYNTVCGGAVTLIILLLLGGNLLLNTIAWIKS